MKNITVDYKLGVVEMPLSDADYEKLVNLAEFDPQKGQLVARMTLDNYPCDPIQGIETLVHIDASGVLMVKDFNLHWTHSEWVVDSTFDKVHFNSMALEDQVDYLVEHSNRTPEEFAVYNLFDLLITDDTGLRLEVLF